MASERRPGCLPLVLYAAFLGFFVYVGWKGQPAAPTAWVAYLVWPLLVVATWRARRRQRA